MARPLDNAGAMAVSGVFEHWLGQEVRTSNLDRNKYLDNFELMRERITLGFDNEDNWSVQKHNSHMRRLPRWWEAFKGNIEDDKAAALITFHALMEVSGMHRVTSYIRANSQEEYLRQRQEITAVRVRKPVKQTFDEYLPGKFVDFSNATVNFEDLERRKDIAAAIGDRVMTLVSQRLSKGLDTATADSECVTQMRLSSSAWLKLATASVIFNAKVRDGSLPAVPLYEPRTISDAEVYYPFGGDIYRP